MKRLIVGGTVLTLLAGGSAGCGLFKKKSVATLKPTQFYARSDAPAAPQNGTRPTADAATAGNATPRNGVVPTDGRSGDATAAAPAGVAGNGASTLPNGGTVNGTPNGAASADPGPGVSSGSYMLVGTVVGEVNGQPIFADKVLARLEQALYTKATQDNPPANPKLGPKEFRLVATGLVRDQVREDVNEELLFAAAQRNTTEEEKQMAGGVTTNFRQKEIIKAGGALAVARANSLREGIDFEERVQQEYRRTLVRLFLYKKVWPRVQVSADDLRQFYDRNVNEQFTEKAEVRFRLVRIGAKETGGNAPNRRDLALEKIHSIREKAARGDDFAKLARTQNDDRLLRQNEGYMDKVDVVVPVKDADGNPVLDDKGQPAVQAVKNEKGEVVKEGAWVQKGSLRNEELEKAVFALDVGGITDVIDGGEYFYVAKLEDKKLGRVRAFEDPDVQEAIRRRLEGEQQQALRNKEIAKLRDAAIVRGGEETLEPAIEMAMQKYYQWNRPPAGSARAE